MGIFFLIAGSVLFFAGLACLLIVFVTIARRLKANLTTSIYFKGKSSRQTIILTACGVALIVCAQGFYWFHGEATRYIPFDTTVPTAQISFIYQQYRQPRLMIETTDQNNNFSIQMVPFAGDRVSLGVELIRWNKLMKILGMKDCYRISGMYSVNPEANTPNDISVLPDHNLNGGPTGLTSMAQSFGSMFPADFQLMLSEPIITDGRYIYSISIAPDRIVAVRSVDNSTSASY